MCRLWVLYRVVLDNDIKTEKLRGEVTSIKVFYSYLFLNIKNLDALNFIISIFQASTCFEHICLSSGGQNCIIQSLVSSHLSQPVHGTCFEHHVLIIRRTTLYYTASGIIRPIWGRRVHGTATYKCYDTRCCIVQFCPPDDEHMCLKHVEAWNKLIIKFSASSCLVLINMYIEMHGQQNIKIWIKRVN